MTTPTKEQTLEALAELYCERTDLAERSTELMDRIRSYIESHTGEVVAWITVETDGKVRTTHKKATADMWRAISGSKVSPLFASPVQPDHIADVGKMICPRSANGRPEGFTVYDCVAAGECGCGESVTPGSTVHASPVQPVKLEWVGKTLNFNGLGIGRIWMDSRGHWNTQLGSRGDTEIAFGYASREDAENILEQSARKWLSTGDK